MSANKYLPHLLVIPEDDANRDIVTGFLNHLSVDSRRVHVENVAGGWEGAIEIFVENHVRLMRDYNKRHVLILIDFDDRENRFEYAQSKVPDDLRDRVFIMGSSRTPEELSADLQMPKEKIGELLADECIGGVANVWQSPLLVHNEAERARMRTTIFPYLRLA